QDGPGRAHRAVGGQSPHHEGAERRRGDEVEVGIAAAAGGLDRAVQRRVLRDVGEKSNEAHSTRKWKWSGIRRVVTACTVEAAARSRRGKTDRSALFQLNQSDRHSWAGCVQPDAARWPRPLGGGRPDRTLDGTREELLLFRHGPPSLRFGGCFG